MSDPRDTLELERFFPYRITHLATLVSRSLAKVYGARFGLAPAEWRVLAHLARSEEVSVREIHLAAELDKAKISRAVARLEAMGAVSKTPNRTDRRLVALSLTEKGRRLYEEIVPLALAFEDELLSSLSPTERRALDRIIGDLSERLSTGKA